MKHASTRLVAAHWNKIRGRRRVPDRADVDPGAIRSALADTFILYDAGTSELTFRLAGTRLCSLFGRELKGGQFAQLWDEPQKKQMEALSGAVTDELVGVVGGAVGWTLEGYSLDLEWLLLPLRHRGYNHVRLIGSMAPLTVPYWLGNSPVMTVALNGHRFVGTSVVDSPKPVIDAATRWRRGLRVYDGGQV